VVTGVRYYADPPGTGYGYSAEEYLTGLRAARLPVTWTPMVWHGGAWGPDHPYAPFSGRSLGPYRHDDICNVPIEHDVTVVHWSPMWHDSWSDIGRLVACTAHETDRIPHHWVPVLNRYDAVMVPSTQNLAAFRDSGVGVPLHVVPHIARAVRPVPHADVVPLPDHLCVFYVINTWTTRKALPETILAFLEAFTDADDVALVVKTTEVDRVGLRRAQRGLDAGPFAGQTWWSLARLLAGRAATPPIRLVTRDFSRSEIDALHTRGDCFVSLTRGEGWGLGGFEAGAAGNPVVMTGWGGHLDYLPDDYPYRVDHELVATCEDEPDDWFDASPDYRWARADIAHAAALLRQVYENRDEARYWGRRLRRTILEEFSAEQVMPRFLAALSG
jgi:glycosyltransferase involved in cell wall biosynthesis